MKALKFPPAKHTIVFFHLPSSHLIMGYETTYLKRAQPVSMVLGTCIKSNTVLLFKMAISPSLPHIIWSPLAQCLCAVPLSWEVFCLLKTHSLWATKPRKILYLTALCTLGPQKRLLQSLYCKQQKISSCQTLKYSLFKPPKNVWWRLACLETGVTVTVSPTSSERSYPWCGRD